MPALGKLVLSTSSGEELAIELSKEEISIGRDPASDIVLADGRVSRSHARLEYSEEGFTFIDLGSANGSMINNHPAQRVRLSPGDLIQLGNSILRFEVTGPLETPEVVSIDSMTDLEKTIAQDTVNMTIYDTSHARMVIHAPDRTWEVHLVADRMSIGRQTESDIYIPHPKISRQHARIERREGGYVIQDLGSANGTFLGSRAIQEHLLRTGDTLKMGPVRLVFKEAFQQADLTLVEEPTIKPDTGQARHPVVIVPGLMGSELWSGNERIWPNVRQLFTHPEVLALPEKIPLEPRGIVNEVVIVPNLIKQEQYNRLGDYLVESLGYRRQVDLMEFAYDWRQDVRQSARRLARAIDEWEINSPVILIAHSLGSLVSRYYVERLGGKSKVEQAIFLGGPHYGVPKIVGNHVLKTDLLPFGMMGDRLREILTSFPSVYQILPIYNCVFDQNGDPVQVLEDGRWLPEDKRPLLKEARQFRRELGRRLSVPSVSIFGYGLKTVSRIDVGRNLSGELTQVELVVEENGDSSIPEESTILEGSEIHPVGQYHGSLYVDSDVKMRLKLELTGLRKRA